jgi:hypothetical protein
MSQTGVGKGRGAAAKDENLRTTGGYLGDRREITREQEKLSWAN